MRPLPPRWLHRGLVYTRRCMFTRVGFPAPAVSTTALSSLTTSTTTSWTTLADAANLSTTMLRWSFALAVNDCYYQHAGEDANVHFLVDAAGYAVSDTDSS
jgi:hypothetical protein